MGLWESILRQAACLSSEESTHASLSKHTHTHTHTLVEWCQENNFSLSINKTKVLIVDYRRQQREHALIHIDRVAVERVKSLKFLSVHIIEEMN